MKNGVFESFRALRSPSAAEKRAPKGPIFAHSTPFCAFCFENFAVFFTSERTPQRKKSTPNFSAALTFFGHRPPNFFILQESDWESTAYEHPSKLAHFRPRTLFFRSPPVFWGVNRPFFENSPKSAYNLKPLFPLPSGKPECLGSFRKKKESKWLVLADFSLNLRPKKHRY